MSTTPERPRPSRPLRALAELLVRGPEAPFVLGDLDEGYGRDVARGTSTGRAARRYLANALASAARLGWSRIRSVGACWLDVKLGVRLLRRQPALTAVSVFALAIGIPASMIPFHLMRAFDPRLPFEEGDRIVGVENRDLNTSRPGPSTLHDFETWRASVESFRSLGAARSGSWNLISDDGRAAPVLGSEVTASTFRILRVAPLLGRPLLAADETPGAPDVVVIGHDIWRSRLAGDPDVFGRRVRIGRVPHEVVGVMPKGFLFPFRDQLWLPLRARAVDYTPDGGPALLVYGRLADGVDLEHADAEVGRVGARLAEELPDTHGRLVSRALSFPSLVVGTDPSDNAGILVAQAVALLLLLVACGNVGILILARTASRTTELSIRAALGAGRARIVAQVFVETLVLAVLAAGLGLALADVIAGRFFANFASEMPFFLDLGVTVETAAWALLFAAGSAVVAGVIPALRATGRGVHRSLQRATAGASGLRFGGMSTALIVAEVAVAVCFLTLGGTLVRTALTDRDEGMGIEAAEYLSVDLRVPSTEPTAERADTWAADLRQRVATTQREFLARLRAEPGVQGVAMANVLPGHDHHETWIQVEGEGATADSRGHYVRTAIVDPGYFEGFGKPILSGRGFDQADLTGTGPLARRAIIVNTSFVRTVLGDRNALGRRVRYTPRSDEEPGPWYEIVGVVGHLGMNEASAAQDAGLYHPAAPGDLNPVGVAIHVGGDPLAFVPRLRELTTRVDPAAMIDEPYPMTKTFSEYRLASLWGSLFFGLLSSIAIVLSAAGLYALISFTVSQRTREIGIRTALGALPRDIVLAVGRRALLQLVGGVLLGSAVAGFIAPRAFTGSFTRSAAVWPWPVLVGVVAATTLLAGLAACLPPTLRGLRIRPVDALKEG